MHKNYSIDNNGVLHQTQLIGSEIVKYDTNYVDSRYNSYGVLGMQMAYLRVGYVYGKLKSLLNPTFKVLDVGYGNGDYLRAFSSLIGESNCMGSDISNYPLPDGINHVDMYQKCDVISFFDVLEHFEDISFVKDLNCSFLVISVPNCKDYYSTNFQTWFENWRHRRPNEHLWHFSVSSLIAFFEDCGFKHLDTSYFEDAIRKPSENTNTPNILTCIFKKN